MTPAFQVPPAAAAQQAPAVWAAALLEALARDEAAGRRPPRLTEPRLATWTRFKGRLTAADFLALLFEDAAVLHPIPFDPAALGDPIRTDLIPPDLAEAWLRQLPDLPLTTPGPDYVLAQARRLGLPTRLARSDLHVVKPHHKVLELPGTGGQLGHHLVHANSGITLQDNLTIACSSWQELTLAGLIALDVGAPHSRFITQVFPHDALRDPSHPLRARSFDFVVGLHPDKGGQFRIQDQLAIWFPHAKALLV